MGVKWRELQTIFSEELRRGSRRAWYRIVTFAVPAVLLILVVAVPLARRITADDEGARDEEGDIGLVDRSGILAADYTPPGDFRIFPGRQDGIDALLDGEINAVYVIPRDYLSTGKVEWLHTRSVVAAGYARDGDRLQALQREALVTGGLDAEVKARFLNPATFESTIVEEDRSTREGAEEATMLSASYIFMILMAISVVSVGGYLLSSVVEEKENRMIEILLTSASPLGVMAGKVLALGTLGLVQVLVWTASLAVLGPRIADSFPQVDQLAVDAMLVVWAAAFFVAGCFVVGVAAAGIGAAATSFHEARQLFWPVVVPVYVPMVLWNPLVENPDGMLPRILSFVPITAPVTMMLRLGAADIALVEVLGSLAVTALGGVVLLWGSARVFRAGLLLYGQRMTLRGVVTALRQAG